MRRLIPRRWGVRGSAMSVASADAGDRGGPCETSERPQRGQRRRSASPLEVVVGAAMGDRIPPGFWRNEGELEIGFGWLVGWRRFCHSSNGWCGPTCQLLQESFYCRAQACGGGERGAHRLGQYKPPAQ
jgi:hypothetical protein